VPYRQNVKTQILKKQNISFQAKNDNVSNKSSLKSFFERFFAKDENKAYPINVIKETKQAQRKVKKYFDEYIYALQLGKKINYRGYSDFGNSEKIGYGTLDEEFGYLQNFSIWH